MAKKISKNSKKYQQNIAKQKYLNKRGIKVEIGGPWGSWQEEQYNKIKSQEHERNIAKQRFLNSRGIKVKVNGSWGPWQEEQYRKLTSRDKAYNTTPYGFLQYLYDSILGDGTTYQEDPLMVNGYVGEIKPDNRSQLGRKLDNKLQHNDNFAGWFYQNVIPSAGVASFIVNPTITARTIIPGTLVGGAASFVANAISKNKTGKTTEELAAPYTGNELSFLGNPGNYFGAKTAYNFKNLGRFVVDNVYPASYIGHGADFAKAYIKALNPANSLPTFKNGRRPKWIQEHANTPDINLRFENMAEWAGIPEKEVPRKYTISNNSPQKTYKDPLVRFFFKNDKVDNTRGFTTTAYKDPLLPEVPKDNMGVPIKDKKIIDADLVFGIGGLHSDFTYKGRMKYPKKDAQVEGDLWLYEDEQKLNPQYMLADKIKNTFNITKKKNPILTRFIDYFGGKDLKGLLGFDKDIKYKQFLLDDGDKVYTIPYNEIQEQFK